MKRKNIIILIIPFTLIVNCKLVSKSENKNIIYEELALKYFNDSIINSEKFNLTGKTFFFDGIVTGISKYYYDPFEVYKTDKYKEAVEFKKSYLNNNAKDFYIEIPAEIKEISFDDFKKSKNSDDYFLRIKHYIKSKNKILVVIYIINKDEEIINEIYTFLDLKGSLTDLKVETHIFIAPR
jgi:hypothetical protein